VTVITEDDVGNMCASETLFFTVEEPAQPEPFPATLVATDSVIIVVVAVMRKHKH